MRVLWWAYDESDPGVFLEDPKLETLIPIHLLIESS